MARSNDGPRTIRVDVPVSTDGEARQATHLHVNLCGEESQAFHAIRAGLLASHATLPGGRPVWTNGDVVRWLSHQAASALR